MSGKRKVSTKKVIAIVCGALVLLLCLIGGILYFTRGDGNHADYTESKRVVSEFLESYRSKNPDVSVYLQNQTGNEKLVFDGFQGLLAEKIDFEIKNVRTEDDQLIVNTEISNIDFKVAFTDVIQQLPANATQEEILEALKTKISTNDCAKKTFACEIIVVDNGEEYKIIMTDMLSNALLGGYNEYLAELTSNQGGAEHE